MEYEGGRGGRAESPERDGLPPGGWAALEVEQPGGGAGEGESPGAGLLSPGRAGRPGGRGQLGAGASWGASFVNVLKANVGAGTLAMPFAFSHVGWLLGTVVFLSLAGSTVYNMHLLLGCQGLLQRHGISARTYGDVAVRSFGRLGRDVVDCVLVFTQLGICAVYFVFFVDSFPRSEGSYHLLHAWQLVLVALPIPLGLASVGNVKDLAPFSALANCAISLSLAVVLALALARLSSGEGAASQEGGLSASRPQGLPLFIGNAIFAMEGIGLVLPCANQAADKAVFPRVLSSAMLTACCFYLLIGLLCFLSYGYIRDASITAEMEHRGHAASTTAINLMLCGAVLLSHPLQLRPAAEVLNQRLLGGGGRGSGHLRVPCGPGGVHRSRGCGPAQSRRSYRALRIGRRWDLRPRPASAHEPQAPKNLRPASFAPAGRWPPRRRRLRRLLRPLGHHLHPRRAHGPALILPLRRACAPVDAPPPAACIVAPRPRPDQPKDALPRDP